MRITFLPKLYEDVIGKISHTTFYAQIHHTTSKYNPWYNLFSIISI